MTPEHHERVGAAFLRARALAESELRDYLAHLEGTDAAVREEVESLLRHDAAGGTFLAEPVLDAHAAAAVLRCPAPEEDELPVDAGAYRILRALDEGNSAATVYLAQQTAPVERLVALKVLRRGGQRGEAASRFRAECAAIARMQHPGIASMFEASFTPDGRPFFVMEYIEGPSITDYCQNIQPPLRDVLALFLQVVEAVAHAHLKAVVHRDLKPTNILVADTAEGPRAKVIDFGVAKCLEPRATARSYITAHGQIVGTLAYMAPEQLGGDPAQVDARADVYALGSVLHEMITGRCAVDLEDLELPEAIQRVGRGRGPVPRQTRLLVPRDIDLIIAKAMAPEPARRYQSASELGAEIERFLESRPVLARRPGVLYVARKAAARHPALTTGLVVALFALSGSAPWVLVSQQRAQRHYEVSKRAAVLLLKAMDPLADQVGARPERRLLLTQALQQAAAFTAQEAADPEVQRARATIVSGLADLEEEEGRLDRAAVMNREVLEIRQRMAAAAPADLDRQAELSIALVRMGDMHKGDAHRPTAIAFYRSALQIDERLAAMRPDEPHFISNLAWSYERLGAHSSIAGDRVGAMTFFTLQLRMLDRLAALNAQTDDLERCRTSTFLHLGSMARDVGDDAGALAHSQSALAAAERALAAAPGSRLAMMCVFRSHLAVGYAALRLADPATVEASAQAAANAVRPLVVQDFTDGLAVEQYLIACDLGSQAAAAMGRVDLAKAWEARAEWAVATADPAIGWGEHSFLDARRRALAESGRGGGK